MTDLPERQEITIRRVRADEWRHWRATRLHMLRDDAAFFSTRYEDMVREPDATWRDWVADAAGGEQKILLVAERDDDWLGVVGAFVRIDPQEVQLISLWVDPRARGEGVARNLIRTVARWADDRGAQRVVLFVQEANEPGRKLYERAGFRPTGDRAPTTTGRSAFKLVVVATPADLLAT